MVQGFWSSDAQWTRLAPLLPNKPRGVRCVDDRQVISGTIVVVQSGGRWIDVPAEYGPHKTLYNRFVHWSAKGVWQALFQPLAAAGGPPAEVLLDSTHFKVQRCATGGKGASARGRLTSAAVSALPRFMAWRTARDVRWRFC